VPPRITLWSRLASQHCYTESGRSDRPRRIRQRGDGVYRRSAGNLVRPLCSCACCRTHLEMVRDTHQIPDTNRPTGPDNLCIVGGFRLGYGGRAVPLDYLPTSGQLAYAGISLLWCRLGLSPVGSGSSRVYYHPVDHRRTQVFILLADSSCSRWIGPYDLLVVKGGVTGRHRMEPLPGAKSLCGLGEDGRASFAQPAGCP
jgi:hypothetical protein